MCLSLWNNYSGQEIKTMCTSTLLEFVPGIPKFNLHIKQSSPFYLHHKSS